jgi:hypothetical protein
MISQEPQRSSPKVARNASIVILVLVFIVAVGYVSYLSFTGPSQSLNPSTSTTTHVWNPLLNVTGATSKNTDIFTISGDRLKVDWQLVPQKIGGQDSPYLLGVVLVPAGEEKGLGLVDVSNSPLHSDTTFVNVQPGSYYLKIVTANLDRYNVTLSE